MSNAQRQAQWGILLSPHTQNTTDQSEYDGGSEEQKPKKIVRNRRYVKSLTKKCYLSCSQLSKLVDFLSTVNVPKDCHRKRCYSSALNAGLLVDKSKNEMSFGGFAQYYAIAMTKKKSPGDDKAVVKHCLIYRLSAETISAIVKLNEKEVCKIIDELSETEK